ncbi:hypothetical protein GCM10009765_14290 [Fodinicola feengrottensis]|uniref:Tetratricopeptide repeat protein n=1 Tax=Fodinicola feengrottensis TaxID=435914 RepID=A0ABN2G5Z2_9ACTN
MFDLRRYAEAEQVARRGLVAEPAHGKLLRLLARTLAEQEKYAEAQVAAEAAVAAAPNGPGGYVEIAYVRMRCRDWPAAVAAAERVVRLAPLWAGGLSLLAQTYAGGGESAKAIETARRALALDPEAEQPWLTIALVERERRDFGAATAAYEEALRRDPQSAHAHRGLAELAASQGQIRQSLGRYGALARLRPTDHDPQLSAWPVILAAIGPFWMLTGLMVLLAATAAVATWALPALAPAVRVGAGLIALALLIFLGRLLLPAGRTPYLALRATDRRFRRALYRALVVEFVLICWLTAIAVTGGIFAAVMGIILLVPYWQAATVVTAAPSRNDS